MNIRKIVWPAAMAMMLIACRPGAQKQAGESSRTQEQAETAMNLAIPDFRMNDINGNEVSALEEAAKHKVTVIDFWASWCGPCLKEMPELKNMYEKYHDKGLGIIGVSLDTEMESWKKAVERLGITWVQVSDLRGWENEAAQLFGVQAIPHTIIIDNKGNLIGYGLRGEELEARISEKLR